MQKKLEIGSIARDHQGAARLVGDRVSGLSRQTFPVLVFSVIIAAFPIFFSSPFYLNVMIFVGLYTIITFGLSLLLGYGGQISVGHAGFFGLGAYGYSIATTKLHLNEWVSVVIALLLASLIALIIGIPTLKLTSYYFAICTLAYGQIIFVLFVELRSLTNGVEGIVGVPSLSLGSLIFDNDLKNYYLVWICVLLVLLISLNLVNSRFGRALQAVRGSESAASALGIDASTYKTQAFVISAAFAALAGVLYASITTFVSPESFTVMLSIVLISMVVMGGLPSIWGSLFGAAVTTILTEYLRGYKDYSGLVFGAILTLVMIFLPRGLGPSLADLVLKRNIRLGGAIGGGGRDARGSKSASRGVVRHG